MRAIFRKELREYRRNNSTVTAMAIIPLIFLIQPVVVVLKLSASAAAAIAHAHVLLYMLAIPALVPALVAAYAVVGERTQGTLEPVLSAPIRREEFLLGKALAALVPSVAVAYVVYAAFLAFVELFAAPAVAPTLLRWPDVLAQIVFTPLLAAWSIWLGIGISARVGDVRVAQQLGMLAGLPAAVVTSLVAFDVIHATVGLAVGCAALLLVLDGLGWRALAVTLNRERLITGTR
ncbi:ABC transporter permease [Micromonospora sp. MS34]|uniref:ABC transporter permease n=1 Tax=Micromonospora sp. MS34 TaxID=3385971 RepID=UPI00399F5A66